LKFLKVKNIPIMINIMAQALKPGGIDMIYIFKV
jgi:hypothetical protein